MTVTPSSHEIVEQLIQLVLCNQPKIYPDWNENQIATRLLRAAKENLLGVSLQRGCVTGLAVGRKAGPGLVHIEAVIAKSHNDLQRLLEQLWTKHGPATQLEANRGGKVTQYNFKQLRKLYGRKLYT